MNRLARLAALCGVGFMVLLAGCSGLPVGDDTTIEEPTDTVSEADELETDEIEGDTESVFQRTVNSLDTEDAAAFETAIIDESGEITTEGETILNQLTEIEALDEDLRDDVAQSIGEQGELTEETTARVDVILASPESFQRTVFSAGVANSNDDALLDGEKEAFGIRSHESHPEVTAIAMPLAADGYESIEIEYLTRVAELAQYQDSEYEVWHQAKELGLLHKTAEEGEITEDDLYKIQNNADNRLINGMEEEFGTDPNKAASGNDGYDDHLKWGPMRDLGLDVNPGETDIYVEVDQTRYTEGITTRQKQLITETFRLEPSDDIGPIHIHFLEDTDDVGAIRTPDDAEEAAAEHKRFESIGAHYMLLTDRPIQSDGQRHGIARVGSSNDFMTTNTESARDAGEAAATVAHELGHGFGLLPRDFDGIDSHEYSASAYPSVMNYNYNSDVSFSTDVPFNDYEHMHQQEFFSQFRSTAELNEMWRTGNVPENGLEDL